MAQLMLVQLALVHSWLLGDLVRDARLVWHWVEGDVRYLSHTCERGEEGARLALLVASVEDDARQCQALGLVHRDNPRLDARVHVHVHV